ALAAFAPALENLINIAVLLASAMLFGVNGDLGQISPPQLLLLGFGTTAAVSVHATVQWLGAYWVGVRLVPRIHWDDPHIRSVIRKGGASIGYVACDHAAYLVILVIAGTVPGGVSAFQITSSFCKLPVALTATPLAYAQLPHLSSYHSAGELESFRITYEMGL